ncbi:MAG: hypothetical protein A3J84_04030 [Ignavibacteria bacterium RIFOXYA2_FULL_37_17]|nr:MAG: hypothetical protein A3J84_04030 [Ignavibacteria bacterium RIFOXYA2_FULL_37_17]
MNNRIVLGFSFLIFGILSLLSSRNIILLTFEDVAGIVFIFYSIPTVYSALNNGERGKLTASTILFLVGVVFLVKSYFEILDTRGIVFFSILFISGSALVILFIENTKEKILLYTGFVFLVLSYLSITQFKKLGLFDYANRIGNLFEAFWPIILIVMGMIIFVNRKK